MASSAASGAPPAMTIHNARGAATTANRTRSASSLIRAVGWCRSSSDFHDLGLFGLDHGIELPDVVVVNLLQFLLALLDLVLAHAAQLLQLVACAGARVTDGDLAVLRELVHDLHEILAPLL